MNYPFNIPKKELISFSVYVEPKSQQHGVRARVVRGKFCGMYNDAEKTLYIDNIRAETEHLAPEEPFSGPLEIQIIFYLKRSKGEPYQGLAWQEPPDFENLCKSFIDAIKKRFLKNDCMICHADIWKIWCEQDLFPYAQVTLSQFLQS